jgi:hypothetical protein
VCKDSEGFSDVEELHAEIINMSNTAIFFI